MTSCKDDIRNFTKEEKLNLYELIDIIFKIYGDTTDIEKTLDALLTRDVRIGACFVMNVPEAKGKIDWHYNVMEGEGYFTTI